MRRLPPLSSLPAFEATARLGSLTAAAAELGRTHGAISKQIRRLSDDLGGALFEKNGNGVRLTVRGERLRTNISPLLDDLSAISHTLRSEAYDSRIIVGVSATLATRWLTPRLPGFYRQVPGVDVQLLTTGTFNVQNHEIDVLLSYDRLRGRIKHGSAISLGDTQYGPVCAPNYELERVAGGWHASARFHQLNGAHTWDAWERLAGQQITADRVVEFPHHFLALDAATAGLGVALAESRVVEADIGSGRLRAPLGFARVAGGFQAVVMSRAQDSRIASSFLRWISNESSN